MTADKTLGAAGRQVYAEALAEANRAFHDKVRELSALRRIADALAGSVDLQTILDRTLEIVIDEIGPENCSVMLMNEATGALVLRAARGLDDRGASFFDLEHAPPAFDPDFGVAGFALASGRAVLVRDVVGDTHYVSQSGGVRIGSMLVAPLLYGGSRLGTLNMSSADTDAFVEDHERIVTILAGLVATAIQNARLVEELLTRERLSSLGKMAATMVHDMRSPVTVIYGFASLMAEPETDDASRQQYLEIIKKQLSLFQSLAEETLEYTRGDEARLEKVPLSLAHLACTLCESMTPSFTAAGMRLACAVGGDGTVMGDEAKLMRALVNLVANALEALSPPDGEVTVRFDATREGTRISVADNGKGIAERDIERIFEPFVSKGKSNGTGLGLPIVRRIVEAHGGRIGVVSAVGAGTTFTLTLPPLPDA